MGCSNTCVSHPVDRNSPPKRIPAGRNGDKKQWIEPVGLPAPFFDAYSRPKMEGCDANYVLAFQSETHERRLKVRLWINGKKVPLENTDLPEERKAVVCEAPDDPRYRDHAISLYAATTLGVSDNEPITAIASFSLVTVPRDVQVTGKERVDKDNAEAPDPTTVMNYLGITDIPVTDAPITGRRVAPEPRGACAAVSGRANTSTPDKVPWSSPYRLWSMVLDVKTGGDESSSFRLNTVGRCIEEVMGVLLVPTKPLTIETPPSSSTSTDVCSENGKVAARPMALMQNVIACQSVDLASTL